MHEIGFVEGQNFVLDYNVLRIPVGRDTPAMIAFFDVSRALEFVEGQNLIVLPNGFNDRNDRLQEPAAALIKAEPDAIISRPDNHTRVLQQTTETIPLLAMTEDMVRAGLCAIVDAARRQCHRQRRPHH